MKPTHLLTCISLCLSTFVCTINTRAQTTKIAIVSVADTTCVYQHVGLTAFTNFTDTLHVNFGLIQHLEERLQAYLNTEFTVTVVRLPDSVTRVKNTFFSQARTKKIKQWIKNSRDLYDLVIVIDNMGLSENDRPIRENTSGLFGRMSYLSYYSTISFFGYRTSNLKPLEYYNQGGGFVRPIKNFKLPDDKRSFTPEMRTFLYDGFKNYLDSRVEYFLTKTYLMPQDRIDKIKSESGNVKQE
ncbi:MAG: hypothetical protein Q8904_08210 [Bacteroidota bacterium]|nr:hypothetical protein [Bacteroidota bacterium]